MKTHHPTASRSSRMAARWHLLLCLYLFWYCPPAPIGAPKDNLSVSNNHPPRVKSLPRRTCWHLGFSIPAAVDGGIHKLDTIRIIDCTLQIKRSYPALGSLSYSVMTIYIGLLKVLKFEPGSTNYYLSTTNCPL